MKRVNIFTVELVKESGKLYDLDDTVIRSQDDAYNAIEKVFNLGSKTKEHFGIFSLTVKNKIIGAHIVHVGQLNASIVHPREVFQQAILNNAGGIIVFHNHPSGDPTPSPEDIDVTNRLIEGGRILGIDVLDHLIIGDGKYISMREKGYFI